MKWQQLIIDGYERVFQALKEALNGMNQDDLNEQPHPDCNSMGWLTWHLTRVQDRLADLMNQEQLWIKDGWHAKFNRPPDPQDSGLGHTVEDLAAFKSPDVSTLLGYHQAVLQLTKRYIDNLSETDLERKINHPKFPTIGVRLMALLSDNLQHAGQVAYLRGLLKGKGWKDA